MKCIVKLKLILLVCVYSSSVFSAVPNIDTPLGDRSVFVSPVTRKPQSKPYSARVETRFMYGSERSLIRPMILLPLVQSPYKITYLNAILMGDTKGSLEGNIGFGARWLKKKFIIGGFGHFDYRVTKNNKRVRQVTIGLEFFEKYLEYRLNVYVPLQDKVFIKNQVVASGTYNSVNNSTTYTTYKNLIYEITRRGVDFEFGGQLPQHTPFAAFVRIFYFHHGTYQKIYGAQFRASYQVRDWMSLMTSYNINNSKQQDNHYFAGFNLIWQLDPKNHREKLNHLSRKMVQMPIRDLDIDTREQSVRSDDISSETVPERGIFIVTNNGDVIIDGSDVVFYDITEANKVLDTKNIKVDHIVTTDETGALYFSTHRTDANTMTGTQMLAIGLGKLNKDRIRNGGTIDQLVEDAEERRDSIEQIRNQGRIIDNRKRQVDAVKAHILDLEGSSLFEQNAAQDELDALNQEIADQQQILDGLEAEILVREAFLDDVNNAAGTGITDRQAVLDGINAGIADMNHLRHVVAFLNVNPFAGFVLAQGGLAMPALIP